MRRMAGRYLVIWDVYAGSMESEPTITQSLLPMEPFVAATAEANEWRGRCLDTFSRAEIAVTECLLALSQVEEPGAKIRLPHLVGQRIDALSRALEPGGPFEAAAGKAAATLLEMPGRSGFSTCCATRKAGQLLTSGGDGPSSSARRSCHPARWRAM